MSSNVCIVGLGLIGGSLGMAIKKKKAGRVFGLTRDPEKMKLAVKLKAVDYASTNIKGLVQESDIIFICYPIHLIVPEIEKIIKFIKPGTIITDVGSSKRLIVEQAEKLMPKGVFFVGGHPMAGKEATGLEHAEDDLLSGKNYILTKTPKTDAKSLNTLKALLTKIGVKVSILDPASHDKIVAGISHMPLLVAASLVDTISTAGAMSDQLAKYAASGFRDTTRIASGDPELGTDMFITNKKEVLNSLASFKRSLAELEKAVKGGDFSIIANKLSHIKAFRDSMFQ
jgi:prephenate dehydrogenase